MLQRRASTTCITCGRTLSTPPAGHVRSPSEARSTRRPRGEHRKPVTVELQFLPGAEPWIRVTFEGKTWRRPGTIQTYELVLWLLGWEDTKRT